MKEFTLAFDIPTIENKNDPFRVKINRLLNKIHAKQIQRSMWQSDNLKELIRLAMLINNIGGSARVLEEKLIFE